MKEFFSWQVHPGSLLDRLPRRLTDMILWVRNRFHPRYRYHVVHTGRKPGYADPRDVMIDCCFECLRRYIYEELYPYPGDKGFKGMRALAEKLRQEGSNDAPVEPQIARYEEIANLWEWWTMERPENEKLLASMPLSKESLQFGHKLDQEDQLMLRRLVELRLELWT